MLGFKLYREVLDFAPAAITSGELVVALVIADDAKDKTRASWIPLPELCFKTRQQPSTVRANLAKLASRGLEFRVPHGTGKDGRLVFAARAHPAGYEVPDLLKGASPVAPLPVDNSPEGASDVAPIRVTARKKGASETAKGASDVAPTSEKGASDASPPFTHLSQSPPAALEPYPIPSKNNGVPVITPSVEVTPAPVDNLNGHFDFFAARSTP